MSWLKCHFFGSERQIETALLTNGGPTWEDEEDARHKGQDGPLGSDVSNVTDDKGSEDKQQRHHGERRGRAHHLCGTRGQWGLDTVGWERMGPPHTAGKSHVLGSRNSDRFFFFQNHNTKNQESRRNLPKTKWDLLDIPLTINHISRQHLFYSLRMFAVFSVVISMSGSVKYSEATHRPFSDRS